MADDPYAAVAHDDPYASVAQPAAAPPAPPLNLGKMAIKAGGAAIGGALNLGKGALEALGAPERAVAGSRSYIDAHPGDYGGAIGNAGKWFMDPKKQEETSKVVRAALSPEQGGFIPTDATINAHLTGLPATLARGAAQAGAEVLADPTSAIPAGAIGKAARLVPGAVRAGEALGKFTSPLLSAEHHLGGLTEHGQNVVEQIRNVVKRSAAGAKRLEDHAIATARNEIKAGQIPQAVRDAFAKYGAAVPTTLTPSKLIEELDKARAAHTSALTHAGLRDAGLLKDPNMTGGATGALLRSIRGTDKYFKDSANPDAVEKALEGVAKHIAPEVRPDNFLAKAIDKTNHQLKSMFLSVPIPHVANLTNLAYNKYGLATTLRGLMYAAREATGHRGEQLNHLVGELQKIGADNQYEKLFSEVNPVGIGPVSVRNLQRFANKAQDTILNPVERGLRAAGLEKEMKSGKVGADAARGLHKAFGSDAENGLTKFLNHMPLSQFPRFHTQTALGSTLRTLADKPGRVTGFEHVFGGGPDRDKQHGYRLSTPTMAGLNFLDSPLAYALSPSTLGQVAGVASPYSVTGSMLRGLQLQRHGKSGRKQYERAAQALANTFIPAPLGAANEMLMGTKGEAGETGAQDLFSALGGGYYAK